MPSTHYGRALAGGELRNPEQAQMVRRSKGGAAKLASWMRQGGGSPELVRVKGGWEVRTTGTNDRYRGVGSGV